MSDQTAGRRGRQEIADRISRAEQRRVVDRVRARRRALARAGIEPLF